MNKLKRTLAGFIVVGMILSTVQVNAYDDVVKREKMGKDVFEVNNNCGFTENKEDYYYIDKKVKKEKKSVTGKLDKDIEEKLNENGVFDEEINSSNESELEDLRSADADTMQIYTQYYAIDDREELKDKKVEESDMIELSEEQADEYISQKYYGKKTDLYSELEERMEKSESRNESNSIGILETIGIQLGIVPITVLAETQSKGGKSDKSNPTMLKKIMVVSRVKDTKKIVVLARYIWDEMPKYRELDSISLDWDNAKYVSGEVHAYHKWTHVQYYNNMHGDPAEGYKKENKSVEMKYNANPAILKNNQYHIRNGYMCAAADLHNDKTTTINTYRKKVSKYYNEEVSFSVYLKRTAKTVYFYPYYEHTKTTMDLVKVALGVVDGGKLSTVYSLTSGEVYKVEKAYSGVNERFTFNF